MIDNTRAATEILMLRDLKQLVSEGGSLDFKDKNGASPVSDVAINVTNITFYVNMH